MKKVISFKKELLLDSKVYEISSISLEHEILEKTNDLISGEFLITGSYKISRTSIDKENFEFKLPFDIALDSRYDVDNMNVDIEDFYYEIIGNDTLKVSIDLYLEGDIIEEEIDDVTEEVNEEERCVEKEDEVVEETINTDDIIEEVEKNYEDLVPEREEINISNGNANINIFDDFEKQDEYATYHVYIVKEEDTLDTILNKYEISKEDLESYNNISEIKKGDKLIIPKNGQ